MNSLYSHTIYTHTCKLQCFFSGSPKVSFSPMNRRWSSRNKWGLHGSFKPQLLPPRWGFNSSMSKLNNQVLFPTSEHFSNRVWTLLNKHLQPETLLNPPKTRRVKSSLLFLKRATKSQLNSLIPSLQHLLSAPNKASQRAAGITQLLSFNPLLWRRQRNNGHSPSGFLCAKVR